MSNWFSIIPGKLWRNRHGGEIEFRKRTALERARYIAYLDGTVVGWHYVRNGDRKKARAAAEAMIAKLEAHT